MQRPLSAVYDFNDMTCTGVGCFQPLSCGDSGSNLMGKESHSESASPPGSTEVRGTSSLGFLEEAIHVHRTG